MTISLALLGLGLGYLLSTNTFQKQPLCQRRDQRPRKVKAFFKEKKETELFGWKLQQLLCTQRFFIPIYFLPVSDTAA